MWKTTYLATNETCVGFLWSLIQDKNKTFFSSIKNDKLFNFIVKLLRGGRGGSTSFTSVHVSFPTLWNLVGMKPTMSTPRGTPPHRDKINVIWTPYKSSLLIACKWNYYWCTLIEFKQFSLHRNFVVLEISCKVFALFETNWSFVQWLANFVQSEQMLLSAILQVWINVIFVFYWIYYATKIAKHCEKL